jgi:hypothetical protein
MLQSAKTARAVPTVRVKAPTKTGFALVNVTDFDHGVHELHDKKDKHLIPPPPTADDVDLASTRKALAAVQDQLAEMTSECDEWKARAEAAEAKLGGNKPKDK